MNSLENQPDTESQSIDEEKQALQQQIQELTTKIEEHSRDLLKANEDRDNVKNELQKSTELVNKLKSDKEVMLQTIIISNHSINFRPPKAKSMRCLKHVNSWAVLSKS